MQRVVIIGGGNAAFCAALAARETGADVLLVQGNVPAHQTDARAALAAARMANSALALEQALMVCSYAFNQPWHEDEWRAAYEERIALARREHNVWAEYDARRLRLEHLMQIGPRAQMEAELRRLQQLTERIDAPAMRASMLRTRAGLAIARGDIASAWPLAQRALTEGLASTDAGTARAIALLQFSALLSLRGDEAQEAIDVDNEVIVPHNSLMIAAGVYVQCLTARWDSALAQMRALAADHFACLPRDMSYGIALANLAYSSIMLRGRDSAGVA